ncbi:MAG: glycosyltransferase family 4 protein [Thermosynechococcaceae cyanobacterium MS004]|nr:glycosyltransferase family 4 protein [Thermosynechococcaceae cyanobacterium MS004]
MRIAYVCADYGVPIFGCKGCSIHVQEVVRALRNQGHQVTIFAARLGGEAPADLADIPIHRLPQVPKADRALREQAELATNLELRFALETAGVFDLIYERYSLWSFTAMEYAQTFGIPGILEVNAPLIEEQAQHRQLIHPQKARQVAQRVFAAAAVLVAVSEGVADYLKTYPQALGRVEVVPNGVNAARFQRQQPIANSDLRDLEPFTVGFVGTMKGWHGLPTLIKAFTQLRHSCPQARLLMVGDGPARPALQDSLEQQGVGQAVDWSGKVSPDAIPPLLAKMDVAVAPYPALEQFYFSPLKVYEYMAAGLPVVASDVGQLREVIQSGVNGLLCPAGDAAALTQSLVVLQQQPALRQRLGQAAQDTILAQHTWHQRVAQILDLARRALLIREAV